VAQAPFHLICTLFGDILRDILSPDSAPRAEAPRSAVSTDRHACRRAGIDRRVRANTTDRFGPVRAVRAEPGHGLVLEVAFEGLARSTRHRSGLAMRFPRISRLRWDKPPSEADTLETLAALLPP
jgi:hypothetical protein